MLERRTTRTEGLPAGLVGMWALGMIATAVLFVLSVPYRFDELVLQAADARGTSVPQWILLGGVFPQVVLGLEIAFVAGFALVGLVVGAARKGLLFGLTLFTYAVWVTPTLDALPVTGSALVLVDSVQAVGLVLATQFFLLFPDGRYVPRWAWLSAPVWVALSALWVIAPETPLSLRDPFEAGPEAFVLLMGGGWTLGLVAQVIRYRRCPDTQRTQMRLPMIAVAIACAGYAAVYLPSLALQSGTGRAVYDLVAVPVFWLTALPMVAAFLVAILRDQLFDVRLVLRRTLVYAALTNVLTVMYAVTAVVLRFVLEPITGDSTAAVAASTLVVAAGFNPARRRIQALVDLRFNRARYDAARVVENFSAHLRQQVDLDELHTELLHAMHETMQPTLASVWLRSRELRPDTAQR